MGIIGKFGGRKPEARRKNGQIGAKITAPKCTGNAINKLPLRSNSTSCSISNSNKTSANKIDEKVNHSFSSSYRKKKFSNTRWLPRMKIPEEEEVQRVPPTPPRQKRHRKKRDVPGTPQKITAMSPKSNTSLVKKKQRSEQQKKPKSPIQKYKSTVVDDSDSSQVWPNKKIGNGCDKPSIL